MSVCPVEGISLDKIAGHHGITDQFEIDNLTKEFEGQHVFLSFNDFLVDKETEKQHEELNGRHSPTLQSSEIGARSHRTFKRYTRVVGKKKGTVRHLKGKSHKGRQLTQHVRKPKGHAVSGAGGVVQIKSPINANKASNKSDEMRISPDDHSDIEKAVPIPNNKNIGEVISFLHAGIIAVVIQSSRSVSSLMCEHVGLTIKYVIEAYNHYKKEEDSSKMEKAKTEMFNQIDNWKSRYCLMARNSAGFSKEDSKSLFRLFKEFIEQSLLYVVDLTEAVFQDEPEVSNRVQDLMSGDTMLSIVENISNVTGPEDEQKYKKRYNKMLKFWGEHVNCTKKIIFARLVSEKDFNETALNCIKQGTSLGHKIDKLALMGVEEQKREKEFPKKISSHQTSKEHSFHLTYETSPIDDFTDGLVDFSKLIQEEPPSSQMMAGHALVDSIVAKCYEECGKDSEICSKEGIDHDALQHKISSMLSGITGVLCVGMECFAIYQPKMISKGSAEHYIALEQAEKGGFNSSTPLLEKYPGAIPSRAEEIFMSLKNIEDFPVKDFQIDDPENIDDIKSKWINVRAPRYLVTDYPELKTQLEVPLSEFLDAPTSVLEKRRLDPVHHLLPVELVIQSVLEAEEKDVGHTRKVPKISDYKCGPLAKSVARVAVMISSASAEKKNELGLEFGSALISSFEKKKRGNSSDTQPLRRDSACSIKGIVFPQLCSTIASVINGIRHTMPATTDPKLLNEINSHIGQSMRTLRELITPKKENQFDGPLGYITKYYDVYSNNTPPSDVVVDISSRKPSFKKSFDSSSSLSTDDILQSITSKKDNTLSLASLSVGDSSDSESEEEYESKSSYNSFQKYPNKKKGSNVSFSTSSSFY